MGSLGSGLVGMFSGPAPRQLKTTACSVDGADQPLLSQIFYRFLQIFTDLGSLFYFYFLRAENLNFRSEISAQFSQCLAHIYH